MVNKVILLAKVQNITEFSPIAPNFLPKKEKCMHFRHSLFLSSERKDAKKQSFIKHCMSTDRIIQSVSGDLIRDGF